MDISKCQNHDCPSCGICWRYIAPANPHRQAYADFKPEEGEEKCEYFIDNKEWNRIYEK